MNYDHAIAVLRQRPEAHPQFVFDSVSSLIAGLCECADFNAAKQAFRTYEPELKRYEDGALGEATVVSLKAALAVGEKNFTRAELLLRQAIELCSKEPGPGQIDAGIHRSTLAVVLWREGRLADSLVEARLAIAFFEQYAPRHPTLVASLNNAACALSSLGREEETERMFQRAIAVATDLYGEESRITAEIMLSYASFLRKSKQSQTAGYWQHRGSDAFRRSTLREALTVDVETLRPKRK